MGAIADVLGIPLSFTHDGKEYTLSPLTFEMMGLFERWLEKRAIETVKRLKPGDKEAEAGVIREIAAGIYSWLGPACSASLGQGAPGHGGRYYLFLRLKKAMPEIDMDDVDKLPIATVTELLRRAEDMDFDPNAVAPAQPGSQ